MGSNPEALFIFFDQDLSYLNETKTSNDWSLTFLLDLNFETLNEMKR